MNTALLQALKHYTDPAVRHLVDEYADLYDRAQDALATLALVQTSPRYAEDAYDSIKYLQKIVDQQRDSCPLPVPDLAPRPPGHTILPRRD